MAQQNLDFNIVAHTKGMEAIATMINRVGALEAETKRLAAANATLSSSTDAVIRNGVRYNNAMDAQSRQLRQARQGTQQLGMQINDFATSVSTGASITQAFNQQIGQVGYAMSMMGGTAGKIGAFLSGPWGAAITIAAMALGPLIQNLWDTVTGAKAAEGALASLAKRRQAAFAKQMELPNAERELADLVRQRGKLEADIAKRGVRDSNGRLMFVYREQQELAKINKQIADARANIDFGRTEKFNLGLDTITKDLYKPVKPVRERSARSGGGAAPKIKAPKLPSFSEAFKEETRAIREAETAAEKFYGMVDNIANRSVPEWINQQRELTDAYNEHSKTMRASEADYTTYQNALRDIAAKPIQDAIKAQQDLADKANGTNNSVAALRAQFVEMANAQTNSALVTQQLIDLIAQFDLAVANTKIAERNAEIKKSYESIAMSVNNAFKGMLTAGMSWKDGMKGIINAVIDELWKLYVVQQIVGFVTKAIGGVTGNPGPAPVVQSVPSFIKAANGTVNAPGGLALVGERGPEIVNLPRGSQVIPAHRSQNMMGGINVSVDARGSSDPAAVRAQVQQGILEAAPAIIAAAQNRTVQGLRRPRLGGVMQ